MRNSINILIALVQEIRQQNADLMLNGKLVHRVLRPWYLSPYELPEVSILAETFLMDFFTKKLGTLKNKSYDTLSSDNIQDGSGWAILPTEAKEKKTVNDRRYEAKKCLQLVLYVATDKERKTIIDGEPQQDTKNRTKKYLDTFHASSKLYKLHIRAAVSRTSYFLSHYEKLWKDLFDSYVPKKRKKANEDDLLTKKICQQRREKNDRQRKGKWII